MPKLEWRKWMSWWEARVDSYAKIVLDVSAEEWGLSIEIDETFEARGDAEGVAEKIATALRACFKEGPTDGD